MAPKMLSAKKPAAAPKAATKKRDADNDADNDSEKKNFEFVNEKFILSVFCKLLLEKSGGKFALKDGVHKLVLVTACGGACSASFALQALIPGGFDFSFTSEIALPAALFILVNVKVSHVFYDARQVAKPKAMAPCFKHNGRVCKVPDNSGREDLFVAGFVCKPFSTASAKRFKAEGGPLSDESNAKHLQSLEAVILHVKQHRPRAAVLENTYGMSMKDEGGASPKDKLIDRLKLELGDNYTISVEHIRGCDVTVPLNKKRLLFFLIDKCVNVDGAAACSREFNRLKSLVGLQVHSHTQFLDEEASMAWVRSAKDDDGDIVMDATRQHEYAQCMATILTRMRSNKGLPSGLALPDNANRTSSHLGRLRLTPCEAARLDLSVVLAEASMVDKVSARHHSIRIVK
jgi:site-specific DNA-cytosine methylase